MNRKEVAKLEKLFATLEVAMNNNLEASYHDLARHLHFTSSDEKIASALNDFVSRLKNDPEQYFKLVESIQGQSPLSRDRINLLNELLSPYGVLQSVEYATQIHTKNGSYEFPKWRDSFFEYMIKNVEVEDRKKKKGEFDYSVFDSNKTASNPTDQVSNLDATNPSPKTSSDETKKSSKTKNKKKISLLGKDYLDQLLLLPYHSKMYPQFYNEEFVDQIYKLNDKEVIMKLNSHMGYMTSWMPLETVKTFFSKTPHIYLDPALNKVSYQIARAIYFSLKAQFETRPREYLENNEYLVKNIKKKYSSLYDYTIQLGKQLQSNGIDIGEPIQLYDPANPPKMMGEFED